MKLCSFKMKSGRTSTGIVRDDEIVDLGSAGLPDDMKDLLMVPRADIEAAATNGALLNVDDVELLSPVVRPGKILAIGLNYGDHIAETGMDAPKHQVWFNKQSGCANSPYGDINLPSVSDKLDYEAELCLVIGRHCKHVPRERAHEVIAGFCCGNDVSVRDWQMRSQTFQIGKSFDTHGPFGPWLVTADEVKDPHDLDIQCYVNDELRQSSNTRHLIFDCYDAIAHLTQAFSLDVGDVLFMGTPAGVGMSMDPPSFLKAGDVVRVEIEGLGAIENRVVPEQVQVIV